ncbi:MAG: DNA-processing protein DprA [Candidatus Saccharimonadales bacterium]
MDTYTVKPDDDLYPKRLRKLAKPPALLYCRGGPVGQLVAGSTAAIVGSRKVSSYGRQVTYDIARGLADQGFTIVSGLATGVDTEAHEAALVAGAPTIAVLPRAIDHIYPASNMLLAKRICDTGGAIISEYPTGTRAYRSNFVARNRIVSGLADVLIITEAGENSGTMHTVNFAAAQERLIFVVPGPLYSPHCQGSNNLLKRPGVMICTSALDIIKALGKHQRKTRIHQVVSADPQEQILLDLLRAGV